MATAGGGGKRIQQGWRALGCGVLAGGMLVICRRGVLFCNAAGQCSRVLPFCREEAEHSACCMCARLWRRAGLQASCSCSCQLLVEYPSIPATAHSLLAITRLAYRATELRASHSQYVHSQPTKHKARRISDIIIMIMNHYGYYDGYVVRPRPTRPGAVLTLGEGHSV